MSQQAELPVLARAAQQVGVRQCAQAVEAVSRRMSSGTAREDVILDWDHLHPDGEPLFSMTGLQYANNAALLSLTAVPEAADNCAVLVERISVSPKACPAVVHQDLTGWRGTSLVRWVGVYANPALPRETVTLVDAPHACLVLRRQVAYGWPGAVR
jgi:hypothetical protein